ncbi:NAD(P)-dependent oxidoreductase [Streptomyces hirsutus]|uniref:NAD(P)-dependent oxidoreductase n=1 Tax=Streptomyces hirsutus TaxID=35620 RepID=UPI0006E1216A|nr:NAD(P)-binding domain-containing protein [Streptomyces hirsutus]
MHLVIGLGPIGGNLGTHLAEKRREVYGYDLDPARVAEWAQESGSPFSGSDLAAVPWDAVTSVHIAVRLADQVEAVLRGLNDATGRPLSIFVNTTLTPTDARRIAALGNENWRIFESPVSGGPAGARHGTMSVFLAGPAPTDDEERLLADQAGHVFRLSEYGQPAMVKLLNNALATYNLTATAQILNLADAHGVPAGKLAEVLAVSTGQSWMSDNIKDVAYDLLLKDVGLLRTELQHLPVTDLDGDVEGQILAAREALGVRAK